MVKVSLNILMFIINVIWLKFLLNIVVLVLGNKTKFSCMLFKRDL